MFRHTSAVPFVILLSIAPQAISQDTLRSAEVCAVTPRTQVYSNAHVVEESGDLDGWDMAVVDQHDSTATFTLYTYEGQLNDEAIRLIGRISVNKLSAKGTWFQHLIEMPEGKQVVKTHSVTVNGKIDSSSFQGVIEIDGYNPDGEIVLKRVKRIWGCKPYLYVCPSDTAPAKSFHEKAG